MESPGWEQNSCCGHHGSATVLAPTASGIGSAVFSSPTPLSFWGEFWIRLQSHGCLLKSTCFVNGIDPEELVGRRVIWFIAIDPFHQKPFWSRKAKQGQILGEKMNLMPGFVWYKIFTHTNVCRLKPHSSYSYKYLSEWCQWKQCDF